jgi:hypothetical protein
MNGMTRALVALVVFVVPDTAFAHSSIPGVEGFYVGLTHPLVEIAQGLAIVATGLFIGQQNSKVVGKAWLAFTVFMGLGLGATLVGAGGARLVVPDTLLFGLALVGGISVAAKFTIVRFFPIGLAAVVGGAIGAVSLPDPGSLGGMAFTTAGSVVGCNLLLVYSLAGAHWIRSQHERPWLQIGLRIVGSWIAAACALMLALALKHAGT